MWRVTSGRPRIIRSQTVSSPFQTQSADPILDKSKVWSGRPIELISIPNQTDEVAYFHIEIAGLQNTEYEINVFQSPLGDPYDLSFPRDHSSNSSQYEAEFLRRYYVQRNGPSGAMVTVPPNERVNVSIALKGERNAPFGFDVLLSQHLGPDRDSAVTDDNNLDWHFDWLPRPKSGQVTLRLQPERVLFRPWNITPHNRWFFLKWRLGPWDLFNKPRCTVIIENTNTLNLTVSPYLVGWQDNLPDVRKRIPMNDVLIGPNEEVEVPCDLELSNRRDIEKLVVQAFAQVRIPGDNQPFEVESPEKITADWAPYLSRFKDIATLVSMAVFSLVFLVWLFVGIPVPVSPLYVAVPIIVNDSAVTEKQLQASQVTLQPLNESGSLLVGQDTHSFKPLWNVKEKQWDLVFRLGTVILFNRMPFGWIPHTRSYQITLIPKGDLEKRYQPLQPQIVDIELAPPNRPLFGSFTATAKKPISLLPIYGAKLLLTFDLPEGVHPTKIDVTFTVTNKPLLQRPIVFNANQRSYPEDISEIIGDGETANVAIDATAAPGGYIASAIAPNVTRGMAQIPVTINGFKKPEVPVTPPVVIPPVITPPITTPPGTTPPGGTSSGGSGGGTLPGGTTTGGTAGVTSPGANAGGGKPPTGTNSGSHPTGGKPSNGRPSGGHPTSGHPTGGSTGRNTPVPGHEVAGYESLLNNDEEAAMKATGDKVEAGALSVRAIALLAAGEKQTPMPEDTVSNAQTLIDQAKAILGLKNKGHAAALNLTALAYLEFIKSQDDPSSDASKTYFDQAKYDCDNAITAAPDLAYPYVVKITLLLNYDAGSATPEAIDTYTAAQAKVPNFKQLLQKYKDKLSRSAAGREFVRQQRL